VHSFHLFSGEISSGIFIGRYIELPFRVSAFLSRKAIATALLVARKQITGSTPANRILHRAWRSNEARPSLDDARQQTSRRRIARVCALMPRVGKNPKTRTRGRTPPSPLEPGGLSRIDRLGDSPASSPARVRAISPDASEGRGGCNLRRVYDAGNAGPTGKAAKKRSSEGLAGACGKKAGFIGRAERDTPEPTEPPPPPPPPPLRRLGQR